MNQIELLAPAGSLDKCKMALRYGADAVYLGGKAFGLRAFAANFQWKKSGRPARLPITWVKSLCDCERCSS